MIIFFKVKFLFPQEGKYKKKNLLNILAGNKFFSLLCADLLKYFFLNVEYTPKIREILGAEKIFKLQQD